jgi:hypothetical protein
VPVPIIPVMTTSRPNDASVGGDSLPSTGESSRLTPTPPLSVWHRPVSYRAQCWVAWAGLTAFGVRGLVALLRGEGTDVERIFAMGLSLAWRIDPLRGRSAER